jgi:hypothetical protein
MHPQLTQLICLNVFMGNRQNRAVYYRWLVVIVETTRIAGMGMVERRTLTVTNVLKLEHHPMWVEGRKDKQDDSGCHSYPV